MKGRPENTKAPDIVHRLKIAKISLNATDADMARAIGLSAASFYRCMKAESFSAKCAVRASDWLSKVESGAKISNVAAEKDVNANLNEIAHKLRETAALVLQLNAAFKKRQSASLASKAQ